MKHFPDFFKNKKNKVSNAPEGMDSLGKFFDDIVTKS